MWKLTLAIIVVLAATTPICAQEVPPRTLVEVKRVAELSRDVPIVLPKDLHFTSDGRVLLVDEGDQRVVLLSDELELIRTAGREGDGPGEYKRPGPAGSRGPGVRGYAIWDRLQGRLTELDEDLTTNSSRIYAADFREHGFVESLFMSSDSTIVVASVTWPMPSFHRRSVSQVVEFGFDGLVRQIAKYPGYDVLADFSDPLFTTVIRLPYGARTIVRFQPTDGCFWVARTNGTEFEKVRLSDGMTVSAWSMDIPAEPVTRADRVEYLQGQEEEFARSGELSRIPKEQWEERWNKTKGRLEFPEEKPRWEDFVLDEKGNLWIRLSSYVSDSRTWLVVSPTGTLIERIQVSHEGPVYAAAVEEGSLVVSEQNDLHVWELVKYEERR